MSTLAVPEKWISEIDEKKLGRLARFALEYRIGSAAYETLPVGAAVTQTGDGLLLAPTLSPGPLTVREFLGRVYELGNRHFELDQSEGTGDRPRAADLRLVLLDERDREIGKVSKKLKRGEPQTLRLEDTCGAEHVNESNSVLASTVRTMGGHLVAITSIEARSRNEYESVMCNQMREVSTAWQEVNKDREKIAIDLCEAVEARVRAEEEGKRLALERQLAEDRTFMDSNAGQQLMSMVIGGLGPKVLTFVDTLLTTASVGLKKRELKASAELAKFRRELEAQQAVDAGDHCGDRPAPS